ncbi:DUF1905 domain-containing protein [Amnibacterium flavum]|uniref:DUF1905 domain-containing protein n=1 Tax=Amnibacterium flavum TaxID=2173173 RepID=A0A2V1HR71_9MICO|nr:DUF1905 domain-containing protein [Amnibacterium flavum]PVZ95038.1 DUF1905 domain-containing protein [Amnibacterium flavum]
METQWECVAELVPWDAAQAAWVFAALPEKVSDEIDAAVPFKGGFGSVKVDVLIGTSRWRTSVFPDSSRGCYVLPVKKAIRKAEGIELGDRVTVHLSVVD